MRHFLWRVISVATYFDLTGNLYKSSNNNVCIHSIFIVFTGFLRHVFEYAQQTISNIYMRDSQMTKVYFIGLFLILFDSYWSTCSYILYLMIVFIFFFQLRHGSFWPCQLPETSKSSGP